MSFPEDMEFGNLTINVSAGKSYQISVFTTNLMYVTYHADVFVPQRMPCTPISVVVVQISPPYKQLCTMLKKLNDTQSMKFAHLRAFET